MADWVTWRMPAPIVSLSLIFRSAPTDIASDFVPTTVSAEWMKSALTVTFLVTL